jgi:hypothetical protein
MQQLPAWFQGLSVGVTLFVELVVPFLVFGTRRLRRLAAFIIIGLQILIAATGNFGFFNLLSAAICLPLLDDAAFPERWRPRIRPTNGLCWGLHRWGSILALASIGPLGLVEFLHRYDWDANFPGAVETVRSSIEPFRSVNAYGLFSIMTTRRIEFIVEGSDDGSDWHPYEFRWKPGDVARRPRFTGLHLPRLDWQMWFLPLSFDDPRRRGWFEAFLVRVMRDDRQVLMLLARNPFPAKPPRFLRVTAYEYHFTDWAERHRSGAWWRREWRGLAYAPFAAEALPAVGERDDPPK